jgi:hypothetical protein
LFVEIGGLPLDTFVKRLRSAGVFALKIAFFSRQPPDDELSAHRTTSTLVQVAKTCV